MCSGSVIRYPGKRGVTWSIRYRDADGRRVAETLGREADGWDKRRATDALRERLVDVKREGRRRLEPVTFGAFAREWLDTYPDTKDLKRLTREGYESIVEAHLVPAFGRLLLSAIDVAKVDAYLARKRRGGLAPRTLNRHLNLLHAPFQVGAGPRARPLEPRLGRRAATGTAATLAHPDAGRDRPRPAGVRRARRRSGRGRSGPGANRTSSS
jgi:Phage integrase, N-terminal SAM-like domain